MHVTFGQNVCPHALTAKMICLVVEPAPCAQAVIQRLKEPKLQTVLSVTNRRLYSFGVVRLWMLGSVVFLYHTSGSHITV